MGFLQREEYRKAPLLPAETHPALTNLWGLMEIRPHMSYTGYWKFDGFQETGFLHLDTHWEFRTGTEFHTGINFTRAGVIDPFEIIDGVVVPAGTYDHEELAAGLFHRPFAARELRFEFRCGGAVRRRPGTSIKTQPQRTLWRHLSRRSSRSITTISTCRCRAANFTANLASLRFSYSFTPKILLQALVQYNDVDEVLGTNLRFSWLRTANSGLYLVYNEIDEQRRWRTTDRTRVHNQVQPHIQRVELTEQKEDHLMSNKVPAFATIDPFDGMTGDNPGELQNLVGGKWVPENEVPREHRRPDQWRALSQSA